MCGSDSILAEARVIGVRSERAFDLELANGHRLVGFVKFKDRDKKTVETGARVNISLSPFDLSKGQIVFED